MSDNCHISSTTLRYEQTGMVKWSYELICRQEGAVRPCTEGRGVFTPAASSRLQKAGCPCGAEGAADSCEAGGLPNAQQQLSCRSCRSSRFLSCFISCSRTPLRKWQVSVKGSLASTLI